MKTNKPSRLVVLNFCDLVASRIINRLKSTRHQPNIFNSSNLIVKLSSQNIACIHNGHILLIWQECNFEKLISVQRKLLSHDIDCNFFIDLFGKLFQPIAGAFANERFKLFWYFQHKITIPCTYKFQIWKHIFN